MDTHCQREYARFNSTPRSKNGINLYPIIEAVTYLPRESHKRMIQWRSLPFLRAFNNRRFVALVWAIAGLMSWITLGLMADHLISDGRIMRSDLQALLHAGQRVARSITPYELTLHGSSVKANSLFYSYPPPMAQLFSLFSSVPIEALLVVWGIAATLGLICIAALFGSRLSNSYFWAETALVLFTIAPTFYPYSTALLYGNADSWFPFLYGVILLGAIKGESTQGRLFPVVGGVALGLASIIKLQPASLHLWFLVRGCYQMRALSGGNTLPPTKCLPAWLTLLASLATVISLVTASLLFGGTAPWVDYFHFLRSSNAISLTSMANIGPGSQLALLLGRDSLAWPIATLTSIGALCLTAWAAQPRRDVIESLAWACIGSLVVLPVTWYHYLSLLIPFGIATYARSRSTEKPVPVYVLLICGVLVTDVSFIFPVGGWVGASIIMIAIHRSARMAESERQNAPHGPSPGFPS